MQGAHTAEAPLPPVWGPLLPQLHRDEPAAAPQVPQEPAAARVPALSGPAGAPAAPAGWCVPKQLAACMCRVPELRGPACTPVLSCKFIAVVPSQAHHICPPGASAAPAGWCGPQQLALGSGWQPLYLAVWLQPWYLCHPMPMSKRAARQLGSSSAAAQRPAPQPARRATARCQTCWRNYPLSHTLGVS